MDQILDQEERIGHSDDCLGSHTGLDASESATVPDPAPAGSGVFLVTAQAKYLVIDTETSDIIDFRRPADAEGQGRVAEFCGVFLDHQGFPLESWGTHVRPNGWAMTPGATAVNGLTTEWLTLNGEPIDVVLDFYCAAIDAECQIIAFNSQFDCKAMRGELRRARRSDRFSETPNICVMRAMAAYNKSQGNKYKWPKLEEACEQVGHELDTAHSAHADALAAAAVFRYLLERDALPEAKVHLARQRPQA